MTEKDSASQATSGQKKYWMRWIVEGAVLIVVFLALHLYQARGTVSGQAPEIRGQLLGGTPVSLGEFRGQPVLLQFWASWCPVCSMEQSSIQSIAQDHAVLSIALDDGSADEIRRWMASKGVSYRVILDPSGHISSRFGVKGVPTSMIIDASGEIRFVEVGYTTETGLRLRLWWVGG
jgi:peroxiredoxin